MKHLTTPAGIDDVFSESVQNVESGVGLSLMTPIVLHTGSL